MIDLHSHVLPGLDDGVRTIDEALALCAAAAAGGVEVLAGTPHVRRDYPTTPQQMEGALAALRAANPAVQLVPGGELDLAELDRPQEELARFGIGGSTWLLVETPYVGWPLDIADRLFRLRVQGFGVVLAHPERNADVQRQPDLLEPLVAGGTLVQLTAASVDGRLGTRATRCARTLLERRLAHLIASDAHAPDVRAVGLAAAVATLRDEALARWLTHDVPESILQDAETPTRPESRPRRRWFR
ncbi:MAG TPA: CpsB/CapC family capsule biosynthesis tyrosine phosphatase [Gaiellaceae bacterium]|nr:CpsB/CapC family capsule biosynthesis tyrosine phosphatase [Gaiellaceae bacterium]